MAQTLQNDRDLLIQLDFADAPLLGEGGEARVYAANDTEILRIMRPGAQLDDALARQSLLGEIARGAAHLPFRTPMIHRVQSVADRIISFEARVQGEPVSTVIESIQGDMRRGLIASYLDTSLRIGDIALSRDWHGPLVGDASLRRSRWSAFLKARLEQVALTCPEDLRAAVLLEARHEWREPDRQHLVHLDYFPANVMACGDTVLAVIDFGPSAVMGDPRFDAWGAVAYLDAELSPHATDADRQQAMDWLTAKDLIGGYAQAKRWIAASWTHAADDAPLMAWCRRILLA